MAATDDFLAELDAEFGKQKGNKKNGNGKKKVDISALNKATFTTPRDLRSDNEIAHSEDFESAWTAVDRETWIMTQECECCGSRTSYIAGEYVHFANSRAHAKRQLRNSACPDDWNNNDLPMHVEQREQTVTRCVKCLLIEQHVEDLWSLAVEHAAKQLVIPGIDTPAAGSSAGGQQ